MAMMLVATLVSGAMMVTGIFWTLHRVGKLERGGTYGRASRRWSIGGEAEFSIPEWLAEMRRGRWDGPALPLLAASLGGLGVVYGLASLLMVLAYREGGNLLIAGLMGSALAYATFNLARMLVRANGQASEILRRDRRHQSLSSSNRSS